MPQLVQNKSELNSNDSKQRKENEREVNEVERGVYKRDMDYGKGRKIVFLHFEGKIVLHHWESNFTPTKNNYFTLICKPNNVK